MVAAMRAWGKTDIGLVRRENQDAFCVDLMQDEETAICVVCDGMGGANAGGVASIIAARTFSDAVRDGISHGMSRAALEALVRTAVSRANEDVWRQAEGNPECEGMGTTLVAAVICGELAAIANVGDSRAYLICEEGIQRVTRDHSIVEDLITSGNLTREQARTHPEKNIITRALGTPPEVECDIYWQELQPGKLLLLCSDGLSNMVEEQEMLYETMHGGNREDACRRLIDIANSRGGRDNITVLLYEA